MYHYCYRVHIFSASNRLAEALKQLPSPDQISLSIENHPLSQLGALPCQSYSILVLDLSAEDMPDGCADRLRHCAQLSVQNAHAKLVLCANSTVCGGLTDALLQPFHAIWPTPLSGPLIHFYFNRLLQAIKLEKDAWITHQYLETTINSIPDLVWYKDVQGAHIKVNDGFCEAVGKTKADCEGRGHYYIWDLKREEYEKGEYVCLETEEIVMRKKETCLFDEMVKSKRGMRQFKTYKSPIFDELGELVGTMGIAHDVTDFSNMGTELEIILGSLPFAGLLSDSDGRILNINEKFLEYFHTTREDILRIDFPTFQQKMRALPSFSEQGDHAEITLSNGDETIVLDMRDTRIFDVFNQQVGHFCTYQDITERKKHLDLMENYQRHLEADVKKQVKINQAFQKNMLISFADIISSRDMITGGHIKRTSKYVELLVNNMQKESLYQDQMSDSFVDYMYISAPLHDIGKVSIPDDILHKPGKYIPSEYEIMKQHTSLGGDILDTIMPDLHDSEYYRLSKDMAKYHHERWDGMGYPQGLKGEGIPLCARIMAIADVFDALTSERPYKAAFTLERARRIILDGRGSHFDPAIVDVFLESFDEMAKAANELNACV